jgi:hypothetical protein
LNLSEPSTEHDLVCKRFKGKKTDDMSDFGESIGIVQPTITTMAFLPEGILKLDYCIAKRTYNLVEEN